MLKRLTILILLSSAVMAANQSLAQTMQVPEVGAFLPSIVDVKPGETLPIDGLWSISSLDKVVRIDRGRIYAIEGWNHLVIFKIKPGMVVIKQFKQEAPGIYTGQDLPLQGPLKATLTGDRILDVNVAGAMGEVRYQLIPQQLDDQSAFNELIKEIRGG
ncbi:hypothetical protein [Ketobacter alkanivorans]|uniref:Uncharacterized protein n=1 Tax=Ketobacter alkanivorans TaxID=1917421 RepID=A0A2K9LNT1_9GAMM|nr:hypothetical protein [Ketobacter alkanivorans]AUM13910.1 hypothetical protein Kalk_16400 [Ketobacter alkanivorans]